MLELVPNPGDARSHESYQYLPGPTCQQWGWSKYTVRLYSAFQHWRRACDYWIPGALAAGESERIGCSTGRQTKTDTVGWCGPVLHILHTYHSIPCRANQYLSSHIISVQIVGGINTGWLKEVFPGSFQRNQEWNLLERNTIWNTLIIHFCP